MNHVKVIICVMVTGVLLLSGCQTAENEVPGTFGHDAAFLKKHTDAIVLKDGSSQIVVVPQYQGRVMTTTASGKQGPSSGWINYDIIAQGILSPEQAAGKLDEHMYAFGGEERFWMGPEGGQYSIFFAPGTPFEFDHWFTPAPIDTLAWETVDKTEDRLVFAKDFELLNHSGTRFQVGVKRTVALMNAEKVAGLIGTEIPTDLNCVGYQTINTVSNRGEAAWEPQSGLLSIWILCMFQPSPTTTVFIPYQQGPENTLGDVVNADYFGAVPPERLTHKDGVIYFKTDGRERGKIGVTPERSQGVAGSYDPVARHMTLLLAQVPEEHHDYVNSMWEMQDEPFKGDALNSYNDGPVGDDGEQMGPFYELESSSPALALKPGASGTHVQTVIHLYGEEAELQAVLSAVAPGVDLTKVKTAL